MSLHKRYKISVCATYTRLYVCVIFFAQFFCFISTLHKKNSDSKATVTLFDTLSPLHISVQVQSKDVSSQMSTRFTPCGWWIFKPPAERQTLCWYHCCLLLWLREAFSIPLHYLITKQIEAMTVKAKQTEEGCFRIKNEADLFSGDWGLLPKGQLALYRYEITT